MHSHRSDVRAAPGARGFLLLACAFLAIAAGTPGEYQVKAAFLYNFAKFVQWPASEHGDFAICVVGGDAVVEQLQTVVDGKTAAGSAVKIRRIGDASAARGCRILYLTEGAPAGTSGPGVLVVGESEGFTRSGGMINFVIVNKKVRFEVNKKSAESAGLSISSHLLKLAHDVIE